MAGGKKRQVHEEHENHERWLVSYADFITLLFAFFVVMYAVSRVDVKKAEVAQKAIRWATHYEGTGGTGAPPIFETPVTPGGCQVPVGAGQGGAKGGGSGREALEQMRKKLERSLSSFLLEKQKGATVELDQDGKRLTVRLAASRFFDAGQAALVPDAVPILDAVAAELGRTGKNVRIEGHTDDTPPGPGKYRNNWDLSAARAATVVSYLEEAHHMAPGKMTAAGFAATRPLVPNDSSEHREVNRRIAFVLELQSGDPLGLAVPSAP